MDTYAEEVVSAQRASKRSIHLQADRNRLLNDSIFTQDPPENWPAPN